MGTNEMIYQYKMQISDLKRNLTLTDYKAIKFAEGEITATEYAPVLQERRKWRDEINALETKIKALRGK